MGEFGVELCDRPAHDLQAMLARREISAVDIAKSVLSRIASEEPTLHAYLATDQEDALACAKEIDRRRMSGETLPALAGIPIAVADNICTLKLPTTCASRMLEGFISPYEATVVQRIRQAGLPIVGKTNMDEFGWGCSTASSAWGPTKHPWNHELFPGGAHGGAAAAVAAGEAVLAIAGDTGGSLRHPAALCGLVGLKPTYGLVSRYGLVASASSFDQIGPMTRDVRDCALMLNLLAGADPMDPTSRSGETPDYTQALEAGVQGMVVGLPREYLADGVDPRIADLVIQAARRFEDQGARVEEVSLFPREDALAAYSVILAAELSSNLARLDGVRYGHRSANAPDSFTMFAHTRGEAFGPGVKRAILMGTYVLSAGQYQDYYLKAAQVRTLVVKSFSQAFSRCDLIVTPTAPTLAGKDPGTDDLYHTHRQHGCTLAASLAGLPALSLPCGTVEGMPVGLQLIAPPLREERLLTAAYTYEQAAGVAPLYPEGRSSRE
ncbi:MAG: Asp-tRNA(Asn)/Glu-tRNA(Gln) amidotransferase subunit GatA [Firmicutes bacterium]|jgi:aspartyl-tRNA(Asn)/glutamyl-tRNA(Gln) amidotransferase subunit A|nr:Asp-tRNA(Asn)/Glu-tRNA(Gln) amidotransferase subunit GatA [Bacillota bacterium]